MSTVRCPKCGNRQDWQWEEAFDKFGFDDGDGVVMTGDVVKALERAGYAVRAACWGLHNVVITCVTRDGVNQIPDGTSIGYDDPRAYLPQELVDFLDRTFGEDAEVQL